MLILIGKAQDYLLGKIREMSTMEFTIDKVVDKIQLSFFHGIYAPTFCSSDGA